MLDLRFPSGWFFVLIGVILIALGIFDPASRAALTPVNINLDVGLAMLVFGAALLLLAMRKRKGV